MTILLKRITHNVQQVNTYIIEQPPCNHNITLEQLLVEFEIKPTAVILIDLMKFHLNTVERMNEFANRMPSEIFPLSLLTKMRNEDIDAYGYRDKFSFVHDFYKDKRSAFERLFQEPAHDWKMNKYKTDDPERIYDVYLEQGRYSHMTQVSMFA
ncbi:UNVERIFIED_CONTAM: hypothetical protein ABIC26_002818 [Paenibacillus sp. PvR008]